MELELRVKVKLMEYKKRIIDTELDLKLEAFGATLIVGPKGCGKTTSAKQKAKSYVEFQDEEQLTAPPVLAGG